jgi:hypothetical protein
MAAQPFIEPHETVGRPRLRLPDQEILDDGREFKR